MNTLLSSSSKNQFKVEEFKEATKIHYVYEKFKV